MSVLQRKELEDSPLADLHAIASELGIEGYRGLLRDDLVGSIIEAQGGDPAADAGSAGSSDDAGETRERPRRARRGRGGSRSKSEPKADADDGGGREPEDTKDYEVVTGVIGPHTNGSGMLKVDKDGEEVGVYVSGAQIRRCELRPGDEVTGPIRPPRRNENHPSLVRIERVNGLDPDEVTRRPTFSKLTPVHPTERFAVSGAPDSAPFGKGSRVALAGGPGAGASTLLRELVAGIAKDGGELELTVVLAGVRPEEATGWRREEGATIVGGSFDDASGEVARAVELALSQAQRVAEGGGDAVLAIDSLEGLSADLARKLFGAGRKLEEGGSLTVIAAMRPGSPAFELATTRIVFEPGSKDGKVAADASGSHRADLLG